MLTFFQKNNLENTHSEEFNNFNIFWDRKMEEYINEAKKIEESLLLKQTEFYKNFEQEIEKSIPLKPKESAELLNLKKIEEQLAQQKEYIEAHKVQQKRIQLVLIIMEFPKEFKKIGKNGRRKMVS